MEMMPSLVVSGGESLVHCYKEQYCIRTWNIRSIHHGKLEVVRQGKLEVVRQGMARVNINVLGISKLKWAGMGKFNSDYHCVY